MGKGTAVRGILRPCRRSLGPELSRRWRAHLCGLCLTLRDVAGQPERVLTGYDVLLLSVLVEAQAGAQPTRKAGACPLRGFQPATVLTSDAPGARLAATGALLSAAAGVTDKLHDDDLVAGSRGVARRAGARMTRRGVELAAESGLDPSAVLAAPLRAVDAEQRCASTSEVDLAELLRPTGDAVAALFAQTAVVAGRPGNRDALAEAGQAFGRLVHLLDAVEDVPADLRAGHFNPLLAAGTPALTARRLAEQLEHEVVSALQRVEMVDRALVDALFGQLSRAVRRAFPELPAHVAVAMTAVTAGAVGAAAVFGGGGWGGGGWNRGGWGGGGGWGRRGRRRRGWDDGGYPPPGYGYGPGFGFGRRSYSRGPGCCDLIACNCCANAACDACSGDDDGCCCVV